MTTHPLYAAVARAILACGDAAAPELVQAAHAALLELGASPDAPASDRALALNTAKLYAPGRTPGGDAHSRECAAARWRERGARRDRAA